MSKQLLTPEQFRKAEALYKGINRDCDARIWNKDGQNESVYRRLKGGVRGWESAKTYQVIDSEGFLLIDSEIVETARAHQQWQQSDFEEARRRYGDDVDYRMKVNLGNHALAVESIQDITAAQTIYDTYKGQFGPPIDVSGPTYTEQVLAGAYRE